MIESPKPEERKIIKDITNIFRLKKELDENTNKDIRNLFRIKKETRI